MEKKTKLYERVEESFKKQNFLTYLGAELEEVSEGQVTASLEKREEILQSDGFIHAGAISALADETASAAALTMMEEGSDILSVEFKLNLMRPAATDKIYATGKLVKPGRTISTVESVVVGDDGKEIARMLGTMFVVKPEKDEK